MVAIKMNQLDEFAEMNRIFLFVDQSIIELDGEIIDIRIALDKNEFFLHYLIGEAEHFIRHSYTSLNELDTYLRDRIQQRMLEYQNDSSSTMHVLRGKLGNILART